MVSFKSSFILLAAAINVAFTFPIVERTLSQLTADFEALKVDLAAVSSDLSSLSSTGVDGLDALDTDSNKLIADIEQATSDFNANGPLDEADSRSFLAQEVAPATNDLISVLDLFVTQKPVFDQLASQVPGLIEDTEQGIEGFEGTTQDLMNALDNNNPPDVVAEASGLITSLANAFETAIATFSD